MKTGVDVFFFNLTFWIYFSGFLAYSLYLAVRKTSIYKVASFLMMAGLTPHTIAFISRWILAKHVPLSNMYEYLSVMGWTSVVMLVYINYKYRKPFVGALISPVVIMLMVAAALLPKEVNQSLMPALQSIWLHIHVSLAAIGSGCFLIAYGVSFLYLIFKFDPAKNQSDANKDISIKSIVFLVFFPVLTAVALRLVGINPQTPDSFFISQDTNIGGFFVLAGVSFTIISLLIAAIWKNLMRKDKGFTGGWIFAAMSLVLLLGGLGAGFLIQKGLISITHNLHLPHGETAKSAWLIFEFIGIAYLIALILSIPVLPILRFISTSSILKSALKLDTLDEISYKTVSLGYPLYTVGALFAGAIWAEQAWGAFWSWDPKEVGALIIWLFYSGYLHARYLKGWSGSRAAILVIIGFLMVVLSFFGNYFFGGLHAYA